MTARRILRTCLVALAVPVMAGCSALGALESVSEPLGVYDLQAPVTPTVRGAPLARDVIVELPSTGGVLNTDRILIKPTELQAQYLPDVRWGDETPVMLQTLMLRTLENSNGLRYVGRRPLGGSGDFAIVTELTDFQASLTGEGDAASITVRMISRLVRESDAQIVSSRSFAATVPAASLDDTDLVTAFDAAADAVLLDFATWALGALGRRLS